MKYSSGAQGGNVEIMGPYRFGPDHPSETYVPHAFTEQTVCTGEVAINYAVAGTPDKPALLLIPGQTESWWGYESAMDLLKEHFQIFAVDLAGREDRAERRAATRSITSAMTWCASSRL